MRLKDHLSKLRRRDPGTGAKTLDGASRVINHDGTFNVQKVGAAFNPSDVYHWLLSLSWGWFFALIVGGYAVTNLLFALAYCLVGVHHLSGITPQGMPHDLLPALFFSAQTLTTVGYGAMAPSGTMASLLAAFEAFIGLFGFSVFTGLLYGRFSRPTAHFRFSENALVAPYEGGMALMFRVANERPNLVMNLSANVMLMLVEDNDKGGKSRQYYQLTLETDNIHFFPMNWTVVHPITTDSPLNGMSASELGQLKAEVMIQIRGYDETFAQDVSVRKSYTCDEVKWNARFAPAYHVAPNGKVVFDLGKLNDHEAV